MYKLRAPGELRKEVGLMGDRGAEAVDRASSRAAVVLRRTGKGYTGEPFLEWGGAAEYTSYDDPMGSVLWVATRGGPAVLAPALVRGLGGSGC
jgi:hypothetical protein